MFKKKCAVAALSAIMIISTMMTGCSKESPAEIVRKDNVDQQVVEDVASPVAIPSPSEITEEAPTPESEVEEEPPVESETMDAVSAYYSFLGIGDNPTEIKAVVDEGVEIGYFDYEHENVGKELSLSDIGNILGGVRSVGGESNQFNAAFSFVNRDDVCMLVVKFKGVGIDGAGDDSETTFIVVQKEDGLHITYSFSKWSRNNSYISSSGYIWSSGSAGAGEQITTGGILDKNGNYIEVFFDDWLIGDWLKASNDEKMSACYSAAFGNETQDNNVGVDIVTVDGKQYYMHSSIADEYTQEDNEFVNALEEEGIEWTTAEQLRTIVNERAEELTGVYMITSDGPLMLSSFNKGDGKIIPIRTSGETAELAHRVIIAGEFKPDKSLSNMIKKSGNSVVEDAGDIVDKMDFSRESKTEEVIHIDTVKNGKETFKYYTTTWDRGLFETPDGKYVIIEDSSLMDFIYGTVPTLTIDDFDEDGENELLVEYYIYHGTGFIQQSVAILDKTTNWDGEKSWKLFNLTPENYVEASMKHLKVTDMGSELKVNIDGKEMMVSKEGDESEMTLYLDYRVKESHDGKDIVIETTPVLFSENNFIGLELETLYLKMRFDSDGYWKEKD